MKVFTLIELLVLVTIITVFGAFIVVSIVGFHYNTGHGQHTGYITAIEQNGVFFKTWRAYVKTDTQSSQEDQYCVIDPEVVNELTKAVDTKEHVTVSYFSWFEPGITNCEGESAVINGVKQTD